MPSINVKLDDEDFNMIKACKPEGYSWTRFLRSACWVMGRIAGKPKSEFGKEWKVDPPFEITKPCHDIGFCPYGQMVEMFPLHEEAYKHGLENNILTEDGYPDLNKIIPEHPELDKRSCHVFGHDCPVFWMAEPLVE